MRRTALAYLTAALFLGGFCCTGGSPPGPGPVRQVVAAATYPEPAGTASPDEPTGVEMKNVHFRIDEELVLNIRELHGLMGTRPGFEVVNFSEPTSFYIHLDHAEVGMTMGALAHLFRRYIFNYEGAPLTISGIEAAGDEIRQTGVLHTVVDIPFEMTAEVSVTPEGMIRLRPTSMQICSIPGLGLMKALDVQLEDLLDLSAAEGVEASGNDLVMDPVKLLPPPEIRGRLSRVRVEGNELVQVFGTRQSERDMPPPSVVDAENYMFYAGSTLHFGKLFMVEADLQIIDADPSDPFDFFLTEYLAQLAAGYSKTMADAGLVAYFPDYDSVAMEKVTP